MQYLKADTNTEVLIGPVVAVGDGFTPVTTLATSTADEAELIKYGATTPLTVTDISASAMTAITGADGYYTLDLSTGNTDTEGFLTVLFNDDSLCLPVRHDFMVVNANVYDSLFAAATTDYLQTDVTQAAGTAWASGAITAASIGADAITEAKIADNALANEHFAAGALTSTEVTSVAGAALAAGAITNASLAGNMEIVFETDFATNYNTTRNAWATNAQDFVGTTASDPFAGQVVAASVTGAVGSVGGAVASVTNGVTLAAGAITDASLAGNMEIVFETDFSTNYNTTRNAWATNAQDIVGTSASDPFNGQVVAASVTGAVGSVTGAVGSVTGAVASVTGAVGSVTGAVGSVAGNVDGNVTGSVGSNLELGPAEVNTEVDNAMVTYGLDHLMSASVTGTDVTDNSVIAKIVSASATADWDDFVNTTDSLQAVRDHIGDGTNLTETGGDGDHLTEAGGTGDHLTALDVYSIAGNAQAATNLSASARSMQILTVNTGNVAATTTTAQFTGVTEATADHFIGRKLFFYDSGDALFLQGTSITDSSWDAAYTEVVLTFQQLTDTPADGDVAILV